MSLRTSYDKQRVDEGLSIRYNVDLVDGKWYRITRVATKRYVFVGMTHEAALACRAAKIAQYTNARHFVIEGTFDSATGLPKDGEKIECMATVVAYPSHGSAWECSVDVRENDVRASKTPPEDPALLFEDENARDYDGEEREYDLQIYSARFYDRLSMIELQVQSAMPDFPFDGVVIEWKPTSSAQEWTRKVGEWGVRGEHYGMYRLTGDEFRVGQLFRAKCAGIVSSVCTSTY